MATTALEEFTFAHLNDCARIHGYHVGKRPLPICRQTILRLRKKLFAAILNEEVSEDYADAAQRVLSASAKALERQEVTEAGRTTIEVQGLQELALMHRGFKFSAAHGNFIKILGKRREHWLCLFLTEAGTLTATLTHHREVLNPGSELGHWTLPNQGEGLANVIENAERQVANLEGTSPRLKKPLANQKGVLALK